MNYELNKADQLRYQLNTLEAIRISMVGALDVANEDLQSIGVELQFNTAIAHPTYEIHLLDDLSAKLATELAIESRKEKLAQSV
jgi:hypothetical protein